MIAPCFCRPGLFFFFFPPWIAIASRVRFLWTGRPIVPSIDLAPPPPPPPAASRPGRRSTGRRSKGRRSKGRSSCLAHQSEGVEAFPSSRLDTESTVGWSHSVPQLTANDDNNWRRETKRNEKRNNSPPWQLVDLSTKSSAGVAAEHHHGHHRYQCTTVFSPLVQLCVSLSIVAATEARVDRVLHLLDRRERRAMAEREECIDACMHRKLSP